MTSKKAIKNNKSILDVIAEDQIDFFLKFLRNKVRNINKKLKEIQELQQQSKTEELKAEQVEKISKRQEFQEAQRDLNRIASVYLQARTEDKKENATGVPSAATTPAAIGVTIPAKTQKKVEQTKEEKKEVPNQIRSTVRGVVRLVAAANFINQQGSAAGLTRSVCEEIQSLSDLLTNSGTKYTEVERKIEQYITNGGTLQEAVESVVKSQSFKRQGTKGEESATSSSNPAQAPHVPATKAPEIVSHVNHGGHEVPHHPEPKKEIITHAPVAPASSTTSSQPHTQAPVISATSNLTDTNEGGVIADQEADDDRFKESDNQDNQVEEVKIVPVSHNARKVPVKKEEDEWIVAGKKKEDHNHKHHRPYGQWKERGGGHFERPKNQRRGPRRDKPTDEPREPRSQDDGDQVDGDKIREDRARRGEGGEFGKRSNYRKARESGNLRVPEYVPQSQVKPQI